MIGEVLFNATRVVVQAGKEIEAMQEQLFGLLEKKLKASMNISEFEDYGGDGDEADSNGWIYESYIYQYALYLKNKRKPTAYIALQIKLADEAEMSIVGREPLAYILFSGKGEWEYDEFTLAGAMDDGWKLNSQWLWEWFDTDKGETSDRPWSNAQWAFLLPLTSLNTEDDLKNQIVSPAVALLKGEPPEKAFRSADKVLRFRLNGEEVLTIK